MSAKSAKKTAAKTPKPAEPFFRPFAQLAEDDRRKKKAAEAAAKAEAARTKTEVATKTEAARAKTEAEAARAKTEAAAARASKVDAARTAKLKAAPAPSPEALAEARTIEARTFAIYMSGVQALPDRAARIPTTASGLSRAPAPKGPLPDLDQGARAQMRSLVTEGIRFETTDDGDRVEGRRLDVDPRELRRLRRVQFAVDGKLDLHGHGVDEARRAVEAFVKKRGESGDKVVAIIHGKGEHSPRQTGVLRGEIGAWLSQGRAARHVLAFATPPEDEGGSGAVLVLLAR